MPPQKYFAPALLFLPPFLLSVLNLPTSPPFSPPQVIYAYEFAPLFLSPFFSPPPGLLPTLSRLLQAVALTLLPINTLPLSYILYLLAATARSIVGFLLARSVGWKYPALFQHYALYESSTGLGSGLVVYALLNGQKLSSLVVSTRGANARLGSPLFLLPAFVGLLCLLDGTPWTYTTALIPAFILATLHSFYSNRSRYTALPPLDSNSKPSSSPFTQTISIASLSFLAIAIPALLIDFFSRPQSSTIPVDEALTSLAAAADLGEPRRTLLDILILSYPRPHDAEILSIANHSILEQTIESYVPLLSLSNSNERTVPPPVTLTVYTHAPASHYHPAFAQASATFLAGLRAEGLPLTFFTETDEEVHRGKGETQGQYLHAAEALRYALGFDSDSASGASSTETDKGVGAEWVMLVEDDFPLCGAWGAEGLLAVMQRLVDLHASNAERWRGGFIGTGGSGLIMHRTLIPTVSALLRDLARPSSPGNNTPPPLPADMIIQDCLLGQTPACRPPSSRPSTTPESSSLSLPSFPPHPIPFPFLSTTQWHSTPQLVISSRLLMGHIGGAASTDPHRAYGAEKWACRWRHPFHGRPEVDVVVVR